MASKRQIHVGTVAIGGGAPVAVQTMTKTETANLPATMAQIRAVAEAGADIVRVAVPREQDAEALKTIVAESPIPVTPPPPAAPGGGAVFGRLAAPREEHPAGQRPPAAAPPTPLPPHPHLT